MRVSSKLKILDARFIDLKPKIANTHLMILRRDEFLVKPLYFFVRQNHECSKFENVFEIKNIHPPWIYKEMCSYII